MAILSEQKNLPISEESGEELRRQVVNNFNVSNSAVVVGSSDTKINNNSLAGGDGQGGEMEDEMVRIFRTFTMRNRVKFMQSAYDFEDSCNAEEASREKK